MVHLYSIGVVWGFSASGIFHSDSFGIVTLYSPFSSPAVQKKLYATGAGFFTTTVSTTRPALGGGLGGREDDLALDRGPLAGLVGGGGAGQAGEGGEQAGGEEEQPNAAHGSMTP